MVFTITKNVNINRDDKSYVWKQLVLSFLASLPFFTHGVQTILLSSSAHSGQFNPMPDEVPWTATALIISSGVSAPVYCFMIDRFGRRFGIYIVSLLQGASCIPLFLSPDLPNVIILHILAGLSTGGLFTVLPIYIREISSDDIRGLTISFMLVMTTAGYMMKLMMGDEEMMYLMVAMVAMQLVLMLVMVESPSYLIMVGKKEVAKSNIAKLKCLPPDSPTLSKELSILLNEKEKAVSNGKLTFIATLKNQIYREAVKIGLALNTVMVLCGSIVFLDQEKTLIQLKMALDPQKTLVICCMFAGGLLCVSLIRFLERKYLLTMGFSVMVLSMGVLGVYTQADLTVATLRWVPVAALGVLVFAYGIVWALPTVIFVEMLNLEIRTSLVGIIYFYSQLIKLAHIHTFKYIEDYMGIYSIFYIFVGVNIFGGVYTLFAVPNIKGKSVRQIERQLKKIPILQFNK